MERFVCHPLIQSNKVPKNPNVVGHVSLRLWVNINRLMLQRRRIEYSVKIGHVKGTSSSNSQVAMCWSMVTWSKLFTWQVQKTSVTSYSLRLREFGMNMSRINFYLFLLLLFLRSLYSTYSFPMLQLLYGKNCWILVNERTVVDGHNYSGNYMVLLFMNYASIFLWFPEAISKGM